LGEPDEYEINCDIRYWDPGGMAGRGLRIKNTYGNLPALLRSLLDQESEVKQIICRM
jgi:hypothetical protein